MPDMLIRICEFCGGKVVQCLHCDRMLHCIEVYHVGPVHPLCVLCASKAESNTHVPKELLYA